jgi:hypothetical protein
VGAAHKATAWSRFGQIAVASGGDPWRNALGRHGADCRSRRRMATSGEAFRLNRTQEVAGSASSAIEKACRPGRRPVRKLLALVVEPDHPRAVQCRIRPPTPCLRPVAPACQALALVIGGVLALEAQDGDVLTCSIRRRSRCRSRSASSSSSSSARRSSSSKSSASLVSMELRPSLKVERAPRPGRAGADAPMTISARRDVRRTKPHRPR